MVQYLQQGVAPPSAAKQVTLMTWLKVVVTSIPKVAKEVKSKATPTPLPELAQITMIFLHINHRVSRWETDLNHELEEMGNQIKVL